MEKKVARPSSLQKQSLRAGFHRRGYLPHLKSEGATYFVTFRLAGTLPQSVLDHLEQQRQQQEEVLRRRFGFGEMATAEKRKLDERFSAMVDEYLDAGSGDCWLQDPLIAALVSKTFRCFNGTRYRLHAFVIMPNHVHVLVTPWAAHTLSSILHSWKSFTANEGNKWLDRGGEVFWQRESYDHLVRDEEDYWRIWDYIRMNPVKAGLCKQPQEWPYLWLESAGPK